MVISEKMAIKKFGITFNGARTKYKDKILKFMKSEKLVMDIDAISSMEVGIFGEILGEFKSLTSIQLFSARCNTNVLEKYYETLEKREKTNARASEFN